MKNSIKSILMVLIFARFNAAHAQVKSITISGTIVNKAAKLAMPYINTTLYLAQDSAFVAGTISNEAGIFTFENIKPGDYFIRINTNGFASVQQPLYAGSSSEFLNIGTLELAPNGEKMDAVTINVKQAAITNAMDKKTYAVQDNISQNGGSVLQAMENLPGVTIQDNKVQLRGNDKVVILIDGKQSAITGYGSQTGLDNIPASSIERIEIINNPSAKYDANGNAGIINIILKKGKKSGLNGKVGLAAGAGALWIKQNSLPGVRNQYQVTPKINPSISLNYRKNKVNAFFQFDNLYTHTLNKNEFVSRTYTNGTTINQQTVRNRNTNFLTTKLGLDWYKNDHNQWTIWAMLGSEKILDNGDQPFYNADNTSRIRLWQFLEDELKTTLAGNMSWQHKFKEPGKTLNSGLNYTFHREDEKYFFTNTLANYTGKESFKLLSDEHVLDFNTDYTKPLKYGRLETGLKMRWRTIPTNMQFFPSASSPLDSNAGGKATYNEVIPAVYGNYLFDSKKWEGEAGLRLEYVQLRYNVNENHNTYKSDGYDYAQPFPNLRLGYKINSRNKIVAFYNRRVDRPNEVDIRIFPKYDDAEIIKVGNPSLRPQFTNTIELSLKHDIKRGSWYSSAYTKFASGTITRISTTVDTSQLIYAIFQNAGTSSTTGFETILSKEISKFMSYNLGMNVYYNQIDAFTVTNLYPKVHVFSTGRQTAFSGNVKLNATFHFKKDIDVQLTSVYLAPDIIPQGKIAARFTLNLGLRKMVQKGKGELYLNGTDILNTMVIKQTIDGNNFSYVSRNYYEAQVFRIGYNYKF